MPGYIEITSEISPYTDDDIEVHEIILKHSPTGTYHYTAKELA